MAQLHTLTRLALRASLIRKGIPLFRRNDMLELATDEVIDAAVVQTGVAPPAEDTAPAVGIGAVTGDAAHAAVAGGIIAAVLAWLQTAPGQQLLAALFAILTGLL